MTDLPTDPAVDLSNHDDDQSVTDAASRRRFPTWALATVGVVAGGLLGLGVGTLVGGDDGAPTVTLAPVESLYPDDQTQNATAFLDAWERYRNATFSAELHFERRLTDGQTLESTTLIVQQPPRRIIRTQGGVSTVDADTTLVCEPVAAGSDTDTVCTEQPSADYATTVAAELAAWRTAISGDAPAYAVTIPEPGCYELQLVTSLAVPPYGAASRLCFDDATGALRSREIVRTTSTDSEVAVRIEGTVTDADWLAAGG